jgi:large subunit ribosomal protein L22
MKAILRNIRISPKKANLVAGIVRGEMVEDALIKLKFTPKKAAASLYKVIHSATANAETNFKQKRERLYIKEIIVTEGRTYKRSVPISRGRMHPRKKRSSHITVHVDVKAPQTPNSN